MKLSELTQDYRTIIPKLNGDDVLTLWSYRWYDGPLSGVAHYQNQPYWFESQHDDEVRQRLEANGEVWNDWYKPFVLLELTAEQYQTLVNWREQSDANVTEHRNENQKISPLPLHADDQVIGWFEWLWASAEQE